MPELISGISRCWAVASFSSTIASTSPSSLRTIRPYPNGSATTPLRMLTTCSAARWSATKRRSTSPSSSGVSPVATSTVPRVVPLDSSATRTAPPVPSSTSCTASTASGTSCCTCGPTCSRWWPITATTRCGSTARTAIRTWPIMLRPPTWWRTFMVLLFIRVPPPAARTTTVSSSASLMLPG